MARKTGLGRGLGAIFGTDVVESVEESLHQPEKKEENHVSRETSHTLNATAPWLAFLPFSDIYLPSPSLFQYTVDSDTYLNPAA
mgnify:CR=1 FL=1